MGVAGAMGLITFLAMGTIAIGAISIGGTSIATIAITTTIVDIVTKSTRLI